MRHSYGRDGLGGTGSTLPSIARAALAALLCAGACLALVACGASVGASVSPPTAAPAAKVLAPSNTTPSNTTPSATSTAAPPHTSLASSSSSPSVRSAAAALKLKRAFAAFSGCLSRSGVSIPAPDRSSPTLSLKGVDTKSPSYRRASAACIPVLNAALKVATKAQPRVAPRSSAGAPAPGGSSIPSIKVPAAVTAIMGRFTACMRSNGVAGFPKPHGASFDLSGTHVDPHSPRYKAAESRCNSILQALDPRG